MTEDAVAETLEQELSRVEAEERELVLDSFDNEDALDLLVWMFVL